MERLIAKQHQKGINVHALDMVYIREELGAKHISAAAFYMAVSVQYLMT